MEKRILKVKEIDRALTKMGFEIVRRSGSHTIYKRDNASGEPSTRLNIVTGHSATEVGTTLFHNEFVAKGIWQEFAEKVGIR